MLSPSDGRLSLNSLIFIFPTTSSARLMKIKSSPIELTGSVISIGEDSIFVSLAEDVIGKIKNKEFKDNLPSEGDSINSLVTSIDRKNRQLNLSVFALEKSQEKELIKENISKNKQIESETKTSIGDLIQDEIEDSSKE